MPHEHLSRVLLADSHHRLTEGVRRLLETAFETVIMVADEASLLEGARRVQPDMAVVDLSLALERLPQDLTALAPASRRPPLQLRGDRLADRPDDRTHVTSRAAW
jgi:DNA-binding NarL/FixJ family response regulator